MNRSVSRHRQSICSHIAELGSHQTEYTVADILFRYNMEHSPQNLLNCLDTQIRLKQELNKESSTAAHRSTRTSVATFIGHREVSIRQMDGTFVRDYVQFLKRRNICNNTICYYIRNLKAMYNQIVVDGYLKAEEDPFRNLHLKPRKTVKRAVDRTIVRRIAELDLSHKPNLDMARDIFMFSFFSRGMPFVDIVYLKKPKDVIGYFRRKTHQWLSIGVTPQLAALIEKYANDSDYVFPILDLSSLKPIYKQVPTGFGAHEPQSEAGGENARYRNAPYNLCSSS